MGRNRKNRRNNIMVEDTANIKKGEPGRVSCGADKQLESRNRFST
jgi:hypothetical protein